MDPTPTKYFGIQSNYPKIIREASSNEGKNILADVIFEELMENRAFIKEANEARRGLVKNPNKYPNLTLKYKSLLKR